MRDFPALRPGEDFRVDVHGRPADPTERLTALVAMLSCGGWDASVENLQHLSFWEECLAGFLGCRFESLGFVRTPDGPRSAAVEILARNWEEDGTLWRDPTYDPESDPALHPSKETVAQGRALRGHPLTSWWLTLDGFVDGWVSADLEQPCVGAIRTTDDVRAMMAGDPTFLSDAWEASGPASTPEARAPLSDFFAGVARHRTDLRLKPPLPEHVGWYLGRLLCVRAAKAAPSFGTRDYLQAVAGHGVREETGHDGIVRAAFLDAAGEEVAWTTFVPCGPSGETGILHGIGTREGPRGASMDEVAIRHAMTRGARAVAPGTAVDEGLLARHGNRLPEGGWRLCLISYPTCRLTNGASPAP